MLNAKEKKELNQIEARQNKLYDSLGILSKDENGLIRDDLICGWLYDPETCQDEALKKEILEVKANESRYDELLEKSCRF